MTGTAPGKPPAPPLASPPGPDTLLERSQHLATLRQALAAVAAGQGGRLVLIGGEAGAGKTTLVRYFCDAHARHTRVLWGACDALFTPRALGPLLPVAAATGGDLADLVAGQVRPHEVATTLLDELGAVTPTVLVLEDVHWADQATLDVISLVSRRVGEARALVLATYRDDELGRSHPLRLVLGDLATRAPVARLHLDPLSRAAVAELATTRQADLDVDALYDRTGGNPFFVTEALAAGRSEIPATVRDAVLARVARLGTRATRLLEAAAVVPGAVELWLLERMVGEDTAALEECLGSGALVPTPAGTGFRHELARLAVEESVPPDRRLALHRAAMAALATPPTGGPDAARVAHHAEAANDAAAVLDHAPAAAARAAAVGAHREAAAQYARALRFAGGAAPEVVTTLNERHAHECYLTGQFQDAVAAERRALALHRTHGRRREEGDCLRRLSRLVFYTGRIRESRDLARRAVTVLEDLPAGRELAWAYSNVSMQEEDPEEVTAWTARAIELAESLGDREILCHALTNLGTWEVLDGSGQGWEKLEHSLAVGLEEGYEEAVGRAFSLLAIAAIHTRSYERAEDVIARGIAYDTDRDLHSHRLILLAHRAWLELDRGRWEEALATARTALGEPTEPYRVFALPVVALVHARRGQSGAQQALEEARRLAPADELLRSARVAAARAEVAWLEGRNQAAVRATEAAYHLAVRKRASWALGPLAAWRRRAGVEDPVPEGVAAPYRAELAGEWQRAAELWTAAGCPYEAALALADAEGTEPLHRALEELQRLGAGPAADIVARRLRQRGVRGLPRGPRPATRANPSNLTPRQREVLGLLTLGLHNREIAQRLFIATKTVDHHVSAILRKLQVRTRAQAAAEAARLGITPRQGGPGQDG